MPVPVVIGQQCDISEPRFPMPAVSHKAIQLRPRFTAIFELIDFENTGVHNEMEPKREKAQVIG